MHDNAFDGERFGINPYSILGACSMDLMHAFLHGLIPYVIKIIVSSFSTCEKHYLDLLVDEILVPICSGERSKYPRSNVSHGISNLKLLTANEWGGVAFAMALMVCSKKGYDLFQKIYKRKCQKIKKIANMRIVVICQMMTVVLLKMVNQMYVIV